MPNWLRFEINFHQQDEISIFQESTLSGFDEEFYELVAFINYGIRQMSNLGNCEAADMLARALVAAPPAIKDIATGAPFSGFKMVPYPGNPGRKRFVASLTDWGDRSRFDLKMIGFGFLARGFGYYAPISTLALLAHLARRRRQSQWFLQALVQAVALCGQAQLNRGISLGNHPVLAERIVAAILGSTTPSQAKPDGPEAKGNGIGSHCPPRSVPWMRDTSTWGESSPTTLVDPVGWMWPPL